MTTLILNEGDPLWSIPGGGSPVAIYGSSGRDSLAVSDGANVTFDASFNAGNDNIYIQGDSTAFSIARSGATVTLEGSGGTRIQLPAGVAGQNLVFGNGFFELAIDSGQVMIGGQEISSTAAALTAVPDASAVSGGVFNGSGDLPDLPDFYTTVSADIGVPGSAAAFDAAAESFKFTDSANVQNSVEISNFTSNDVIEISDALSGDYQFSNDGEDVNITFNGNGTVSSITLLGVVDSGDIIYSESSFETSIGFDAVIYA